MQYSTPSDHQWKFPLVQELSRAIAQVRLLLDKPFDVDMDTFTYKNDESLIIYRTSR